MRSIAFSAFVAVAFVACSSGDSGGAPDVEAWDGELPIAAPWLRDRLPPGILLYQRVPHALGVLAMPKGNALNAALASDANIRNVLAIQEGLEQNLLDELPLFDDPRLELLLAQLKSPIEIAAYGTPSAAALVAMTLQVRSNAELEQLFAELSQTEPFVGLAGPLSDEGIGELVGAPVPAFLRFEQDSGRVLVLVGLGLTSASFRQVLSGIPAAPAEHPMHALEQRIDASGQGLFGWLDLTRAIPMAQAFMPPETMQMLTSMGLDGARALALGAGVANGKGRMSLVLDVGTNRGARPFPVVGNTLTASATGEPDGVLLLSLPSPEELARLETLFLGPAPAPNHPWMAAKSRIRETLGFGVEEVFAAVGPEFVFVFDAAGDYGAVRVRDQALFDDILSRVAAKTGSSPERRELLGTTFTHWRVPSTFGAPDAANAATEPDGAGDLAALLTRMGEHAYWIQQGDYLYTSSIPQPLMDRVRAGAGASLADWFADRQRIDASTSFFAAAGSVPKLPTRMYHGYIGILQTLGDLTEAEYDLWAMPTADQLGLPDRGTVGFTMNLGEPYLSLELTYDIHPLGGMLGGGGIGSMAAIGILAAIAIPAYQDYTIRAQVSEGMNLAAAVRVAVAEDFLLEGSPPVDRRDAGLEAAPAFTAGRYVAGVDVRNGAITILYGNEANAMISGGTLTLTPYVTDDGSILWRCGDGLVPDGTRPLGGSTRHEPPTIETKYLPAACR